MNHILQANIALSHAADPINTLQNQIAEYEILAERFAGYKTREGAEIAETYRAAIPLLCATIVRLGGAPEVAS